MEVAKSVKVEELLSKLKNDNDLKAFLVESRILTDELSLRLIEEIGGPHSPMPVDQLPAKGFRGNDPLVRLYELQKMGIFSSSMVRKGRNYVRVFGPTPLAKRIAKTVHAKN